MTRCKICRVEFKRLGIDHKVCDSVDCAVEFVRRTKEAKAKKQAKFERRQNAVARAAIKPRSKLAAEAQTAINRWIRHRDDSLPCVSCQRPATWDGQWHAGHYRSTGARPDLRFDTYNIHKQCSPCNLHLSGNLIGYRAELIRRIGQAEVDRLEGPAAAGKLTRDQLVALRIEYAALARGLGQAD